MKHLIVCSALALVLLPAVFAAEPPSVISVKGTVTTQELVSPTQGRIRTSTLDNARIFAEFGVSPTDYALTASPGVSSLDLLPKSASSGLPDIRVADFAVFTQAIDTTLKQDRIFFDASSPATGNLFEGLDGSAFGLPKFKGTFPAIHDLTYAFVLTCRGKDISSSSSQAIIKAKVKSVRPFVQAP